MSQKPDDLEAVRNICVALEPFDETEREKIIKWACERLGMKNIPSSLIQNIPTVSSNPTVQPVLGQTGAKNIKTFLQEKDPKTANQFVAAVAYYYKFESTAAEKKQSITKEDISDACRKAVIKKWGKFPHVILANASNYGLMDNVGTGTYEINSVGENLVVSMPNTLHRKSKKKSSKKN